jgi:hypothetical protein
MQTSTQIVSDGNGKSKSAARVRRRQNPTALSYSPKAHRTRTARPYPAGPFEEALRLADAIHKFAAGEKVRRLTLLQKMSLSPTSSATKMVITNSGKYGITTGSYAAEWLELTETGKVASNPDASAREKLQARFKLAIEGIVPFNELYEGYKGKKIPTHEVLKDFLAEKHSLPDIDECIDLFVVNAKFLNLLQTVAGAEMVIPIEQVLDDLPKAPHISIAANVDTQDEERSTRGGNGAAPDWTKICFYITPIGAEGSEQRKHSDLFLSAIVEPALKDFGLNVVRADQIGASGMITAQILEYLLKSRLAVVDLSFHNPNVFYELAIRHACGLPVVHIIRKADKIPFDINQSRALAIDNTDIYSLVPQLETFRSQLATFVRQALSDIAVTNNPLTVFCPGLKVTMPV